MPAPIISVRGLSKRYRLGASLGHDTLRDHITHAARSVAGLFGGKTKSGGNGEADHIWALKNVSFDVQPGEVLGIVGRNGAGKSTLLKILSRITEPTEGEVRIRGRMAGLLEVGTGFHQELTGRENIYLNGAILGMSKAEINRKFDEIVAFSEVEKFLDTPVKHYSSGMYMRLAFGVAAFLEPEILLVDEVLAVGDIQFQKKCLGKMADVSRSGRTILFVSHNLAAVQKLCTRAILLEQGNLRHDGTTEEVISRYLHGAQKGRSEFLGFSVATEILERQPADARIRVTGVEMFGLDSQPLQHLDTNGGFTLRMHYECDGSFARGAVSFMVSIKTHLGYEVCRLSNMPISGYPIEELARVGHLDLTINSLPLVGGRYLIDLKIFRPAVETILQLPEVVTFEIAPTDVYKTGIGMDQQRGLFVVSHRWHHQVTEPQKQSQLASK